MGTTDSVDHLIKPEPRFPSQFWWGTGASSTQTEGSAPSSDWWAWERAGHAPQSGDGNGFATRYADDFTLLSDWNLRHHRLSLDWSRLEPQPGVHDQAAVEHYRAMLTAGRTAGLSIWVCLLHGALPAWFAASGGFLGPGAEAIWARHVDFVADTFGDLVFGWKPFNGPSSFAAKRYLTGQFPPRWARSTRPTCRQPGAYTVTTDPSPASRPSHRSSPPTPATAPGKQPECSTKRSGARGSPWPAPTPTRMPST
jgi:beta-glucosidase/6-phospho-beta-glucosidase/beta-galactosidase